MELLCSTFGKRMLPRTTGILTGAEIPNVVQLLLVQYQPQDGIAGSPCKAVVTIQCREPLFHVGSLGQERCLQADLLQWSCAQFKT